MKTIHKFVVDNGVVLMPAGAELLSAGWQLGGHSVNIVVWARVDVNDAANRARHIAIVPTGMWVEEKFMATWKFIGTVQLPDAEVYHLFDGGEVPTRKE